MKYAVAYVSAFDNDLQVTVVEAVDVIQGLMKGARVLLKITDDNDDLYNQWLEEIFKKAVDATDNLNAAVEAIQEEFFNVDSNIAITWIDPVNQQLLDACKAVRKFLPEQSSFPRITETEVGTAVKQFDRAIEQVEQ